MLHELKLEGTPGCPQIVPMPAPPHGTIALENVSDHDLAYGNDVNHADEFALKPGETLGIEGSGAVYFRVTETTETRLYTDGSFTRTAPEPEVAPEPEPEPEPELVEEPAGVSDVDPTNGSNDPSPEGT